MAPRSWWERLRAFPTTYGDNVRESLKMLGILEQSQSPHPLDWISIRWWAFRIALLTLRRRPRPSIPVNPPLFVDEQPMAKVREPSSGALIELTDGHPPVAAPGSK